MRELAFLVIGALFGLGATMTAMVAPAYLNLPASAVHWLFWGGIALMILMGVDAIILFAGAPTGLTAWFFNLGLIFIFAAAISNFAPVQSATVSIKGSLFVDCSLMSLLPSSIPQDGFLRIAEITPSEIEKNKRQLTYGERVGRPGEEIKWQTYKFPPATGSRCEIINDTSDPLLDVVIQIEITFTKDKDRDESKAIRSLVLHRLDPGPQNKFVMFLRGEPGHLASLQIPTEATARLSNESKRRSVKVAQATNLLGPLVVLFPFPPLPEQPQNPPTDVTNNPKQPFRKYRSNIF